MVQLNDRDSCGVGAWDVHSPQSARMAPPRPRVKRRRWIGAVLAVLALALLAGGIALLSRREQARAAQAESLIHAGEYAAALDIMEGLPGNYREITAVRALMKTEAELDAKDLTTLGQAWDRMKDQAASGPYGDQAAVLQARAGEALYELAALRLARGEYEGAISALKRLENYRDTPALICFARALEQSRRPTRLEDALEGLESIPVEYAGPCAEEIAALRRKIPERIERREKAIAKTEERGLPCTGLPEGMVGTTAKLGEADEVEHRGAETLYHWNNLMGVRVFTVRCRDGEVAAATKRTTDYCWNGDEVLQSAELPADSGYGWQPSGGGDTSGGYTSGGGHTSGNHASGGYTSGGGDTGPGSGSSLREDYDDPEDLFEDGDYEDLDEAWDEWYEGY